MEQEKQISKNKFGKIEYKAFELDNVTEEFRRQMVDGIKYTYTNSPNLTMPFAIFDSMATARPDRPEGYFLKASLFYSIYNVHPVKSVKDSLEIYFNMAKEASEKLSRINKNDKYSMFYLGAAYGNLGLYYLNKKSYWKAYRNGKKGKNYLEKALKIDPNFGDAQLGLGIFHYYTDVLTKYLKPLLFIVRMSGNRKKGLAYLESAVANSSLSQVEARDFLWKIYGRYEGKSDDAQELIKSLNSEFPSNPYYQYFYSQFLYENGKLIESRSEFIKLLKLKNLKYPMYKRNAYYYLGLIESKLGDYVKSISYLENLLRTQEISNKNMLQSVYYVLALNSEYLNERNSGRSYLIKGKNVDSDLYDDQLKELISKPLDEVRIKKARVDALIYAGRYDEAKEYIEELNQNTPGGNSDDNVSVNNLQQLLRADIQFQSGRLVEAKIIYSGINKKHIKDNKNDLMRYYFLGAELYLSSGENSLAVKNIENLNDMDKSKFPVYYFRKFLNIQQKLFNDIKYR